MDCTDSLLIVGGFSLTLDTYTYIFEPDPATFYSALGIGFAGFEFGYAVKLTPDSKMAIISAPRATYSQGATGNN